MPFDDLRSFLTGLESRGQLRRIRAEVDPVYEIGEIAQRVVRDGGPALLFENVRGSRFPLAINFLGSFERIRLALGMHPEALGQTLLEFAQRANPPSLSALWEQREFFPRLLAMRPKRVNTARCQEVVDYHPDLGDLPVIKCWPQDGGRFITFPLVMTKHPLSGKSNVGIYRMQVFDRATAGMHWQIHKGGGFHYHEAEKRGEALKTAVVLGADPALMLAGIFPLPEGFEEIGFSGILRGRRTRMANALTIDAEVPAGAEFVLEGEVPAHERHVEGPFGDHFGHYCDPADFPVFRVRTMTRRHGAIYPAAIVGKPPQEDRYMGDASQMIMGPLIRLIRPEIADVWAYYEAGFHNLLAVSLEARYTKEPIRTAMGVLGEGQLGLSKVVVLVDRDTDARSFPALLRAIREHFNPRDNFLLIPRAPLDTLDFTSFKMHLGSRMVLDATGNRAQYSGGGRRDAPPVPPSGGRRRAEDFAAPVIDLGGDDGATVETVSPADLAREGDSILGGDPGAIAPEVVKWRLWEDTLLIVQVGRVENGIGRAALERLVASSAMAAVKIIAVVSPDVDVDDDVDVVWGIFTRFDPARDVIFTAVTMTGIQPHYAGVMGIDATWKPGYPDAVEMDPDTVKLVDRRWNEYFK
ncbi:MAG TPA: UbiD family decarboxylase [Halothiobacillaceae bacterium]|nr:UbiD family decarboxylase [Halothiobacillaceae bacterium]